MNISPRTFRHAGLLLLVVSFFFAIQNAVRADSAQPEIKSLPFEYQDTRFDFSLNFPSGFVVNARNETLLGSVVSFEQMDNNHIHESHDHHHITSPKFAVGTYFVEWTGEMSIDEWTTRYNERVGRPETIDPNEVRKSINVDGHTALLVEGETSYGHYHYVNIVRGNTVWFISANGEIPEFETVVESFTFGNSSPISQQQVFGSKFLPLPLERISTSLTRSLDTTYFAPSHLRVPVSGNASCNSSAHTGASSHAVDVGLNEGTSAYASQEGDVFVGWYPSTWGNLLIITTPSWAGTYDIYYAHLQGYDEDTLHSAPFYYVYKNERVAFTGNTGNSTGPHLHFEVRNSSGNAETLVGMTGFTAYAGYPGGTGCANLAR